jgi:hypothetical protein
MILTRIQSELLIVVVQLALFQYNLANLENGDNLVPFHKNFYSLKKNDSKRIYQNWLAPKYLKDDLVKLSPEFL